jgi:hypothetical protein
LRKVTPNEKGFVANALTLAASLWKAAYYASYFETLMKLLFFLVLLASLSLHGYSQVVESNVERFVKEKNIDSFLVYKGSLDGSFPSPDSCQWEEPNYLFWHEKNQWYLKKFDYCTTFEAVLLDNFNPLKFYLLHKHQIDKEKIKEPKYYQTVIKNGRKVVVTTTITASHQLYHHFQYYTGTHRKIIQASEYYLQFEKFDNGRRNINYFINQKTKLKSLIDISKKAIGLTNERNR